VYKKLEEINSRPLPFGFYTGEELWNDEHTSKKMLEFHLNEQLDISSRKHAIIDKSVEWIISHFDIGTSSKIADFGCGPGLYTSRLAKSGADLTGIDFSKCSIAYAKDQASNENLDINYINQNYLAFETERRFDLVMMIMCDYCALNPKQRKIILRIFFQLLDPGGSVLLDVYSLKAYRKREERTIFDKIFKAVFGQLINIMDLPTHSNMTMKK
jgi:2-polyprenyl-3-methyl-5-hydroxy-6-metoxy-1,4-benzoquinol methylase